MQTTISQSVGKGGTNLECDIAIVSGYLLKHKYLNTYQHLDNPCILFPHTPSGFLVPAQQPFSASDPLLANDPKVSMVVDSIVTPAQDYSLKDLISAIAHFQIKVCGIKNPDGRVDPGGRTLGKLVNFGSGPYFPLTKVPSNYDSSGQHEAGWSRSHGQRAHAGFDLYAPANTWILAVADGTVVADPAYFYEGTDQLSIYHPSLGLTLRYGEIKVGSAGSLKKNSKVYAGTKIAKVGKLNGITNSMLHLEIYNGNVVPKRVTDDTAPDWELIGGTNQCETKSTQRLSSLLEPKPYLDQWKKNLPKDYFS